MLILLTLLLPAAGGVLIALLRLKSARGRAVLTETVVLLTSAALLLLLLRPGEELSLPALTEGVPLTYRVDGPGSVFAALIAVLWPLASLYAFAYMEHEERPNGFFSWYTVTYGVTVSICFAANLATIYLSYELLTLCTLPLVWHKQDAASRAAAKKYALYCVGGAAMGFAALCALYGLGAGDFVSGGSLRVPQGQETWIGVLFMLAVLGFGTKAAVLPLSAWLPAASVAPTPVTALLHAVAVVNAGAFAVMRVTFQVFGPAALVGTWAQAAAMGLACATILFASCMAVREQHFKRRLAWSTVSNLSYMLAGTLLMTPEGLTGALCHLVFHGLMKIVLFYCAGAVLVQTGKEYVQDTRGLARRMPFTCAVYTLAALALTGTPPLVGFVSKWNLLTAAAASGTALGTVMQAVVITSAVLTALYLLPVAFSMYFRPLNADMAELAPCDPDLRMKLPLGLIGASLLLLGVFSEPIVAWLSGMA